MKHAQIKIDQDIALYIMAIEHGVLAPLAGFATQKMYRAVVDEMRLPSGHIWPVPVTLAVEENDLPLVKRSSNANLITRDGRHVASVEIEDVFKVSAPKDCLKIFGTDKPSHPGVVKEMRRSCWRIGGKIRTEERIEPISGRYFKTPAQIKKEIIGRNWKTIACFHTRNPIHRAHEHLQRVAMELCDGLFIQPIIGWRKDGDFSLEAIIKSYKIMTDYYYPRQKVIFGTLELPVLYAGPREALLHALVRKNYGCTHFIIGRDHAGVGGHYDRYAAQEFVTGIKDLGIEILTLKSPFYCKRCKDVVTESTCAHYFGAGTDSRREISGTVIREDIRRLKAPPHYMMRGDISEMLIDLAKAGKAFNRNG